MDTKEYIKVVKKLNSIEINSEYESSGDLLISEDNEYSILDYSLYCYSLSLGRKLTYNEGLILWVSTSIRYHHYLFSKKIRMSDKTLCNIANRDTRIFRKRMRAIFRHNSDLYPLDYWSIEILNLKLSNDNLFDDPWASNETKFLFKDELKCMKGIKRCTRSKDLVGRYIKKLDLD